MLLLELLFALKEESFQNGRLASQNRGSCPSEIWRFTACARQGLHSPAQHRTRVEFVYIL